VALLPLVQARARALRFGGARVRCERRRGSTRSCSMEAGRPLGCLPTVGHHLTGRSADVREDPVKGGGERVRIPRLAEPAVVAGEDHRLAPKSLGYGQRGAVRERAL
jgi:hypothetical protein